MNSGIQPLNSQTDLSQKQISLVRSILRDTINQDILNSKQAKIYPEARVYSQKLDENKKYNKPVDLPFGKQQKSENESYVSLLKQAFIPAFKKMDRSCTRIEPKLLQQVQKLTQDSVIKNGFHHHDEDQFTDIKYISHEEDLSYLKELDEDMSMDSVTDSSIDLNDEHDFQDELIDFTKLKRSFLDMDDQSHKLPINNQDNLDSQLNEISRRHTASSDIKTENACDNSSELTKESQHYFQVTLFDNDEEIDNEYDIELSAYQQLSKRRKLENGLSQINEKQYIIEEKQQKIPQRRSQKFLLNNLNQGQFKRERIHSLGEEMMYDIHQQDSACKGELINRQIQNLVQKRNRSFGLSKFDVIVEEA